MSTFAQLKTNVLSNLDDAGSTFYSSTELQNSFQDAYDDIIARSMSIVKKTTLSWVAYDGFPAFKSAPYSVTDYMATLAIFDNVTHRWLIDGLSIRDFLKFRPDWELTIASPIYWAPKNTDRISIYPKYGSAAGTFDLYYAAMAPTVVDADTPLIQADKQCLLEQYCTADLLETAEEFVKANHYWKQYFDPDGGIDAYAQRLKNIAKSDLITLA